MSKTRNLMIGLLLASVAPVGAAAAQTTNPAALAGASRLDAEIAAAKAAMMANPGAALTHARAAVQLSTTRPSPAERVTAELTGRWLEGEALVRVNRPLDAAPVLEAALVRVARHAPGTKLHGDLLKARAGAALVTGQSAFALEKLVAAHDLFRKLGEGRSQAVVLQQIGGLYQEAQDFEKALEYYGQSAEAYRHDPALSVANHNNRGIALKELGRLPEAEAEFRKALALARDIGSKSLQARILSNISSAELAAGKVDQADATARAGLKLAVGADAEWQPQLWGVRAQVALARRDLLSAKTYIERTFAGVDLATSTIGFRELHDTANRIYQALGDYPAALAHLSAAKRLENDARELAATTGSALLAARFDAANQQLRIAKLKAQQLERDKEIARSQARFERTLLFGGLAIGALLVIFGAMATAFVAIRRSRNKVKAANVQLTYAARHDALTGLVNRSYIRELLRERLDQRNAPAALMLIDLDRFKEVNDTLGHWAGDEVLRVIGQRLREALPDGSHAARLGGDEFGAVVPVGDVDVLSILSEKLIGLLSAPIALGGTQVRVGASVGIAVGGLHGANVEELTRNGDLALYHSKSTGRGRHSVYQAWMTAEANARRELEADLKHALAEDQFSLVYQPIVSAEDGALVAFEALLRWEHPTRGNIPPSEFIMIAEEAGIIRQIGEWVIRSACSEAMKWDPSVKVAINLSAVQVEAEGLVGTVLHALAATGLAAERLEFEVTETVFLRQGARTKATLDQLRALGVSLALDDFGTGYSSLGYLQRTEFNKIKIDRSFVQSAASGCQESLAIIQAIVALARSLGMKTTAEGVETEAEKALVSKLGCTQLQGYLIGMPEADSSEVCDRLVA
ncbi:EAL domain-containing protein [Sphingomonas parva]|uniref:EAL domain-containing protein n=1 Tax=Sphingomonas parva TaxID=2555898 RepID=A0A4Y8ZT23_9SPHN|nr:EAL domain-containing protein [Sphingomonas parva]TFI59161.1 EAL domain-containing protein [Sphingomonas parva]